MQLPPPVHGASMMNKQIQDSKAINATFNCHFINLTTAKDVNDIGKGSFLKVFTMIRIWWQVVKTFRKEKFDLVYLTLSPHGLAFYKDGILAILLKLFGAKLVYHLHGKGIKERYNSGIFNKWLYKLVFKKAKVIHLAPSLYADIQDFVDKKNVWFVPNGIKENHDNLKVTKNEDSILYLSNMQESKGSLVLLQAAKILKERNISCKIDFVGKWHNDDSFRQQWTAFYNSNNLQEVVTYHGPKYGIDKEQFFSTAGIFVLPTFYKNECFPIAILEAMSYGLPVVTTNEGAIADIIKNGETGFVVTKKDASELASSLEALLTNTELRKRLGQNSKEEFNLKYTSNIFEKNLIAALNEINA